MTQLILNKQKCGHVIPVFGCRWCILFRGDLGKSLLGKMHDIKTEFKTLDAKLEDAIIDETEKEIFGFLNKLESFIEELYNEAQAIQNK